MSDTKICAVCQDVITGKLIQAEGKDFHHDCFTCGLCDLPLVFGTYAEIDGRRVCQNCRNQDRCTECGFIITGNSAMEVDGKLWHKDCFCCAECGENLKKFFEKDGVFYCQECITRKFDGVCYRCSGALGRVFTKACGHSFHDECFKCAHCQRLFGDDPFVNINGEPWCDDCEADYDNIQKKKTEANQQAALAKATALHAKAPPSKAAAPAPAAAAPAARAAPAPVAGRAAPLSSAASKAAPAPAAAAKPPAPAAVAKTASAPKAASAPPAKSTTKAAGGHMVSGGYEKTSKKGEEEWNDIDDFAFMNAK